MKIIAVFFYYNHSYTYESFDPKKTTVEDIILIAKKFVFSKGITENNYNNLILQWSELEQIRKDFGSSTSIREMIRVKKQTRFKIGYGGYVRLNFQYNHLETFENLALINSPILTQGSFEGKDLEVILTNCSSFLTFDDLCNTKLVCRLFYRTIFIAKNYKRTFWLPNIIENTPEEKEITEFVDSKEILIGYYIGKSYLYLMTQIKATLSINVVRINRLTKGKEIVFKDELMDYSINDNIFYQFRYDGRAANCNKITKDDEIELISINCSKLKDNSMINSIYFYDNKCFVLSSNICLYGVKGGKLRMISDMSKKEKKFRIIANNCKRRQMSICYKFIGEYFYISLNSFFIINILNKREENYFPNIRCVDFIQDWRHLVFIRNYNSLFLLSKASNEILLTINRVYSDLVLNSFGISDHCLNNYCSDFNKSHFLLTKLYSNFDKDYYCYSWYSTEKFLYIKILSKDQNLCREKIFQFNLEKMLSKVLSNNNLIQNERKIAEKSDKAIILSIPPKLFFNGYGNIVINIDANYWFYTKKKEELKKQRRIFLQTDLFFSYHNHIFTETYFIIWSESSFAVAIYDFSTSAISSIMLTDIEELENQIVIEKPIFLFKTDTQIFLVSTYIFKTSSFTLSNLVIADGKISHESSSEKYNLILPSMNFIEGRCEKIVHIGFARGKMFLIVVTTKGVYLTKFNKITYSYSEIYNIKHNVEDILQVKEISEAEFLIMKTNQKSVYINLTYIIN